MIHRFSQGTPPGTPTTFRNDMDVMYPAIQLHDADSADHGLAASISNEIINISGAEVLIYTRAESQTYDDVYDEEPDPVYRRPKRLKAYFPPQPIAAQLVPWGIDVENQSTIVFSKGHVKAEFGDRMIIIGDVIELPYNASGIRLDRYRVLNAFDSGNFRYEWLYWSCFIENLTDDITIDPNG